MHIDDYDKLFNPKHDDGNKNMKHGMVQKNFRIPKNHDLQIKGIVCEEKKAEPTYSEGMLLRKWIREGIEKARRMLRGKED